MTRIINCVLLLVSLSVAASAGVTPGSISGYVRNTGGTPQMGATGQRPVQGRLVLDPVRGRSRRAGRRRARTSAVS